MKRAINMKKKIAEHTCGRLSDVVSFWEENKLGSKQNNTETIKKLVRYELLKFKNISDYLDDSHCILNLYFNL